MIKDRNSALYPVVKSLYVDLMKGVSMSVCVACACVSSSVDVTVGNSVRVTTSASTDWIG